jgi:hypothetical protein
MKTMLAFFWIGIMNAVLVLLGFSLSWRQAVVFLILLGILAWSERWSSAVRILQPAAMLVLVMGIVLAVFGGPGGNLPGILQPVVFLLLSAGAIGIWVGLILLGWKRPVGGVLDLLLVIICLCFPLAVLGLQFFVQHFFSVFPVRVGVGSLAFQMLAVLTAYGILSQFVLQYPSVRKSVRCLWRWCFWGLCLVLACRLAGLGKELLVLRQHEFAYDRFYRRAQRKAIQLDCRSVMEYLNIRRAQALIENDRAPAALSALKPLEVYWEAANPVRRRLDSLFDSAHPVWLTLGKDSSARGKPPVAAAVIDRKRGKIFRIDVTGNLQIPGKKGFETVARLSHGDASPVDMLWWSSEEKLLVLFSDGWICRIEGAGDAARLLEMEWSRVIEEERVPRRLVALPGEESILVAFGDFSLKPFTGPMPEWISSGTMPRRPGRDLLRDICFLPDKQGGYILDAYGGVMPFGRTPVKVKNLREHRHQKYHYWEGRNYGRRILCSPDGREIAVYDVFGGFHGILFAGENEEAHYFGSVRSYFDHPVVVSVIPAYDSAYVFHQSGRIDRRNCAEDVFDAYVSSQQPKPRGILPLALTAAMGTVLLAAPRRVPSRFGRRKGNAS